MMDDPALAGPEHVAALRGLSRLNALGRNAQSLWRPIRQLARDQQRDRLRVLDIATGSGDVPLRLWRLARRSGIYLEITGVDLSRRALVAAREQAIKQGARIEFRQLDIQSDELPKGFDVIYSSLFLHHLDDYQAAMLLRKMKAAAKRLLLVHDLVRQTRGLWLAYLATHLFSTSRVVHADGTRSVRAAFTLDEIRDLAAIAGLEGAELTRCWPYRYLLSWRR